MRPHRRSPDNGVAGPAGRSPGSDLSELYARLAELTESERDLALAGRIDDLLAVQEQRAALVAALPAKAPGHAQAHLRRAAAAQAEVTAALGTAIRAVRTEAVRVERGRDAVAAYRPAAPAAPRIARRG
jgi:hypothetical protein